jgi:biopolymer transport protein ExbD
MINRDNSALINNPYHVKLLEQKLELTPLIDVIFIVIVFLLLTANVRLLSLPVTVPATDDMATVTNTNQAIIAITVSNDNAGWYLEKEYFLDWALFRKRLLIAIKEKPDSKITLAADQQADVQRFVQVLTLLQQQQVTDTRIIIEKK